jgi:hypothetical protein
MWTRGLFISISAGVRVLAVGQDVLIEQQAHRQCCQIGPYFPPNRATLTPARCRQGFLQSGNTAHRRIVLHYVDPMTSQLDLNTYVAYI